jgi:arylsulfatase A-like enzyme
MTNRHFNLGGLALAVVPAICFTITYAITYAICFAAPAQAETERPNVLIIVADDVGYMDFGAYGGEAATPAIDGIAARGTKMSRYYTSSQCAPSRAMLLTGADNHEVGLAMIPETLPDAVRVNPAYSMTLPEGTLTLADRLGSAGYQSYAVGKWHIGDVGKNLPRKHGFDRSLIFDATGADNWSTRPYMPLYKHIQWYEDDAPIIRPGDDYSSKLFVDRMIDYLENADADRPFFGYLAFQAVHIPVQAPRRFTDNYNGRYDAGWHSLRRERFEKGKQIGLIPPDSELPPQPPEARQWTDLSAAEQALSARAMQVNAGMIEAMDFHLNRLFGFLDKTGQLDNTIIIIVSDNGPESGILNGQNPLVDFWLKRQGYHTHIDTLGERDSMIAIGMEWATAAAVPFSRYKFHSTEGGHRVPMIIAGPGVEARGFVPARAHVFDIVPTVLDLAGLPSAPDPNEAVPIRGRSLVPVLTGQANEVYTAEDAVGMEVATNAALYKGDWKLQKMPTPSGDGAWHLYNLASDPGETRDLRDAHPEIFEALKKDFAAYGQEVGIVELGADYNPSKIVALNIGKNLLAFILPYGLGVIFFIAIMAWLGRRLLKTRTTISS